MKADPIKTIFSQDIQTDKPEILIEGNAIKSYSAVLGDGVPVYVKEKGEGFAEEISKNIIADFEKPTDLMVHVSTFIYVDDMIFMSYYANTNSSAEDPMFQTARLAYCKKDMPEEKTFLDIQSVGDICYDGKVEMVYDTILMQKNESTLFVLWTAKISGRYYRLYRSFDIYSKKLGEIQVNRFKVNSTVNDFSTDGIKTALRENNIGIKRMYSDIGIMQKLSCRQENGDVYYYTGTYSGDFNCIIKSCDLITWEYVSQPDFINESKWENAVYVLGDKCFYFVRQQDNVKYGFLTAYNINEDSWDTPVLIADCQSRSDFIYYDDKLYLFHAPIDREHIGIVEINTENIAESKMILQADMQGSCFYPFVQYGDDNELKMSYTVNRKHIRLSSFSFDKYTE